MFDSELIISTQCAMYREPGMVSEDLLPFGECLLRECDVPVIPFLLVGETDADVAGPKLGEIVRVSAPRPA